MMVKLKLVQVELGEGKLSSTPPRQQLVEKLLPPREKLASLRRSCAVVSSKLEAGLLSSESSVRQGCLGSCESSVVEAVRGKLLVAKLASWKVLALKVLSWKLSLSKLLLEKDSSVKLLSPSSCESSVVKVGL